DLAARVVPLGDDVATRTASRERTQKFLASLGPRL
ncbi:LLM class F420-dependent oxidoreductase, partial [Mycobacterium sp. ITM-2017-0098]